MITTVGVLGAGQMGNGIAHVFAQYGYQVILFDIAPTQLEKALKTIGQNLERQAKKGAIPEALVGETLGRITTSQDMNALADVDIAIEAVTENEKLKLDIFRTLDVIVKDGAILASNTSSIPITKIASVTGRPDKVIGMHFMNPVPIMKLVEVIRGHATSVDTFAQISCLVAGLEKEMAVSQDYPGFIVNRVLIPMINEAVFALYDRSLKHKGITAFIVDLSSPGVTILKNENKMGIRGSYTTAFAFDNLRVPVENLLGKEGKGFNVAMDTLNGGRIGIASQALGIAEGAFERALAYSKERKQFGQAISEFQAIQFKLADMWTSIETSKLLTYRAACLKDAKKSYTMESAMCKMHASETATFVTKEAIQIHGGYGYIVDYEVERMYRDAKITEIYEGTNEVQRVVISKLLLS